MSASFQHVFAVCQLGSETHLKTEVSRLRPGWRSGFQRPGLVTWRVDSGVDADVELPSVFARTYGASLGPARDVREAMAQLGTDVVHVFERDREDGVYGPLAERVYASLGEVRRVPRVGELVVDVVVAPDEPLLLGVHRHVRGRSTSPGERPALTLPGDAPSRAWLKIEEAIARFELEVRSGQIVVEIGSSPGGATHALLARGLTVVGVDPGRMEIAHPRLTHISSTLADVRREALPARVDWLLCDVNLAPQVAVHQLRRLVALLRDSLSGVVFTLKMNDARAIADIPALVERVKAMALVDVRATQLPSNRREICVVARVPRRATS